MRDNFFVKKGTLFHVSGREGRVPLQTIRAKIDYCCYTVRAIYGILGIKVWIFSK
ncbi:hypothetical protein JHK82_028501 [Glycine max]|uniref:Small ribosomal subunit protein uS3 C-terminal domain-containing protein n=1 Tax=Glycine max TaxID=3847 RepID=A0A0R0HVB6_SOYBN|nr:hypothetical protein JHK85_029169 [Glycine max]KAG5004486.1 hypothetical protein JHK86_028625 [Glycine max]KAG5127666.1 hypothetical protein JHK82_028501 [Glycine max]KAG5152278.1 hypothetical protein JHK84_028750 [Glycine max]